jgi:preprotein translocase subunit Sec61beta
LHTSADRFPLVAASLALGEFGETFSTVDLPWKDMSGQSSGGGLMSSAGLVRYFDAEDRNAIRIDPKTIVAFGVAFGVFIQVLNLV